MEILVLLKKLLAIIILALTPIFSWASGVVPAVNSDMGCTSTGQVLGYNGTVLNCAAYGSSAYEGTNKRTNAFPLFLSATISAGAAAFNITTDGTAGAASLCPNGIIMSSVNGIVNNSGSVFPVGWAWSNSNKTLTFTVNQSSSTGVIGLLGISLLSAPVAASGTFTGSVWCY